MPIAKTSGRLCAVVLGLAAIATATGLIFSRIYWGYWTTPPSIRPWVQQLQQGDAVVSLECEPNARARVHRVTPDERRRFALDYRDSPRDFPGYQLLEALETTQLPITAGTLSQIDADKACSALFKSGVVVKGTPGYSYASFVRGFLVDGRQRSGERVWIWSAIGGEVTNDHHPVYDLQLSDNGNLTNVHVYYEDIAGIEGARWYVVAALAFIALAVLTAASFIAFLIGRLATRTLARARAGIRK